VAQIDVRLSTVGKAQKLLQQLTTLNREISGIQEAETVRLDAFLSNFFFLQLLGWYISNRSPPLD
jgi:hypothetical protein